MCFWLINQQIKERMKIMLFFLKKQLTEKIRHNILIISDITIYPKELQEIIVEKCYHIISELLLFVTLKPQEELCLSMKIAQEICDLLKATYEKKGNGNPISFRIAITARHIKKVCVSYHKELTTVPFKKLKTYTIFYELPLTRLEIAAMLHQKMVSFPMRDSLAEPKFRSLIERYIHETFMVYGMQNKQNWEIFIDTLISGIFEKMMLRENGYYYVTLGSENSIPSLVLRKALIASHFSISGTLPDGKNYSHHTLENINYCIGIKLNEQSSQLALREHFSQYITTSYVPNYLPEYITQNMVLITEVQKVLEDTTLEYLLKSCPTYHSGYETTMIIQQDDAHLLSLLG